MTKNLALALAAAISMTFAACNNKTAEENAENMDGDTTIARMDNMAENMDGDSTNMNGTPSNGNAGNMANMSPEMTKMMADANSARAALAARIDAGKAGLASMAAADKIKMEKAIDKMQAELEALDKNIEGAKMSTEANMKAMGDALNTSTKSSMKMAEMKMDDMMKDGSKM